ncbi:MAG: dipeptidase [Tumebacillaceae bacterium]
MNDKPLLIDGHADILWRMKFENLDFYNPNSALHLNFDKICKAGIDLQVFALYVGPKYNPAEQLGIILSMIDAFYNKVCANGQMRPILNKVDLARNLELGVRSGMLSIEGGDCLQSDLGILRMLYKLGVRAIGLTWNNGNCIADGLGEPEDRGLTEFGHQVIREMNRLGMVVDVAHLAPKGFWDVMKIAEAPVIASHANAKAIHNHRRNLDDDQLRALFQTGGLVGMTYVPYFVAEGDHVSIDDLLRHIDHMLAIGGENHIGLGSDFDGIDTTMIDLRDGADYPTLQARLMQAYGDTVARKILGGNFKRVLESILKE